MTGVTTRFARPLLFLLCASMLTACAGDPVTTADKLGLTKAKDEKAAEITKTPPTDLDGGVRQAQLLRLAGDYDGAVKILSQLMLVAADDPRVVSEYGKTLTQQGRAQDALPFLTRASELQPDNWSVYSAMGVAYDQLGDQNAARNAYEHALQLRPADPGVLNNYALSRMVANDPAGAQALMEKARIAGGADNAQIARNMKMVASMIPQKDAPAPLAYTISKAAPAAAPKIVASAQPKPFVNLPQAPAQSMAQAPVQNMAQAAPRPLVMQPAPQQVAQAPQPRLVVMQRVPDDPLAGPYSGTPKKAVATVKSKARPQAVAAAKADAKTEAKAEAKPAKADVKAAAAVPPPLPPLPSDKTVAKAEAKPVAKASAKPAAVKTADNGAHADLAIKAADVKPASKKDQVPQLRLAAGIY